MRFFRHFSDASSSLTIQRILEEMGVEGYGQYFLLLELLNSKFDGSSTKVDVHFEEISAKVRIKFSKKLETFMQKLVNFSVLSYQLSGKVYQIDCPILFELMDKDSKYNRKKIATDSHDAKPRIKNKDIDKDKEEEIEKEKIDETKANPKLVTQIWELYNSKLAGIGKIQHTPAMIPSKLLENLKLMVGYPEFQKIENWENYFNLVQSSKWLTKEFNTTIDWLLVPDNAFKVLSGKYRDREHQKQPIEKVSPETDANARAWALEAYRQLKNNPEWRGDYEVDFSAIKKFGKNFSVKNEDRNAVIANLKKAYLDAS